MTHAIKMIVSNIIDIFDLTMLMGECLNKYKAKYSEPSCAESRAASKQPNNKQVLLAIV